MRRYARLAKRVGRLITGKDALYSYDARPAKVQFGTDYGGWTIAPDGLGPQSVVYSFGVGNDVSFDLALIDRFGCAVHGFDPSPGVSGWVQKQSLPPAYCFHPFGLGVVDGEVSFFSPSSGSGMFSVSGDHQNVTSTETKLQVKTLSEMVALLGSPQIDLLKMDVEGAEYDLIEPIIQCPVPIKQLLIEFHHRAGVGTLRSTIDSVKQLRAAKFQLFHVSETSSEFSFICEAQKPTEKAAAAGNGSGRIDGSYASAGDRSLGKLGTVHSNPVFRETDR
jgi:FkbM family methyltransferase